MGNSSDEMQLKLKNELDEVREEYGKFIYAVSHDLSSPFRQIEGFIHLIQLENENGFDQDTQGHFDRIVKASDKDKAILEALLGFSRLINTEFIRTDVNCDSIVEDIKLELSAEIENSNATILCTELPVIVGDKALLYKVFFHLIHNAIHYRSVDRPLEISIKTVELEKHWQFRISDNGIGFSDKMAEDIFIALRRGVSEKKYAGIGMGLTIARSLVHRHDGKISAESVKGERTVISFTLGK